MFKYHCLNPISAVGMNKLDGKLCKDSKMRMKLT